MIFLLEKNVAIREVLLDILELNQYKVLTDEVWNHEMDSLADEVKLIIRGLSISIPHDNSSFQDKSIPTIITTTQHCDKISRKPLCLNGNYYLQMPFTLAEFMGLVKKVLKD